MAHPGWAGGGGYQGPVPGYEGSGPHSSGASFGDGPRSGAASLGDDGTVGALRQQHMQLPSQVRALCRATPHPVQPSCWSPAAAAAPLWIVVRPPPSARGAAGLWGSGGHRAEGWHRRILQELNGLAEPWCSRECWSATAISPGVLRTVLPVGPSCWGRPRTLVHPWLAQKRCKAQRALLHKLWSIVKQIKEREEA